jgi:predicted RND superfamily exporter protein
MTVFFGYQIVSGLKLDNKHGILLPKNAQAMIDYNNFKDMFGEDAGTLVIGIQSDSLFTEKNFLKWKELGDTILQLEGIESVVSEATLFTISNNQDEGRFEAHRVFSDESFKEKSIDSIKNEIKNNPLYEGILYNSKSNVSLMMIAVNEDYISDLKKAKVIVKLEELAKSYQPYFGKPRFAGLPHLRVIIGKRVTKEMYLFIGLLIFVTSILTYFFFRSLRVVFICNLVVGIAVVWSLGFIALFSYKLTVIMALIPPLMVVIGIPNCIFLFTKYHQEVKEHGNKVLALSRVIKKIGAATFLTNLTTSLGFLTFVTTNSPKLMEFGIAASSNIMLVFLLSICILPIIVSLSRSPKPRHLKHLERKMATGLLDNLVNITVYHRRWVYVTTIVVVVFSVVGLFQIEATGNITGDVPEGNEVYNDFHFIQDNMGGTIPLEILVNYKEPSRLAKKNTLLGIEEITKRYSNDTLFSKYISYVDMLKAANMAFHDNDSSQFKLMTSRRKLKRLKRYIDSSLITNTKGVGVALNELIDTSNRVLRIRAQMRDIGSYEVSDKADSMKVKVDSILNPNRAVIEEFFATYDKTKKIQYIDSIVENYNGIANSLAESYINDEDDRFEYDSDPMKLLSAQYGKAGFKENLREAIDHEYFDVTFTGTSIVASDGTKYMVINLVTSLMFAILAIGILMAILFRSWRMVLISMIPNFIPLLFTAGVMGWFGIPLKPSTLLVFSIAFGISVDDTIHYLAKYRLELKSKRWDLKQCIIMAIREAGLGMFYTSIILFSGFIMFIFSQFGGTQALGLLVSLTLLVAMITNLVVLPTLLLSLEHRITTKSFEEPYFDAYAEESNIDWEHLDLETEVDDSATPEESLE